jgi:hypothetical protein
MDILGQIWVKGVLVWILTVALSGASVPDASKSAGILPRPKKQSTDTFTE